MDESISSIVAMLSRQDVLCEFKTYLNKRILREAHTTRISPRAVLKALKNKLITWDDINTLSMMYKADDVESQITQNAKKIANIATKVAQSDVDESGQITKYSADFLRQLRNIHRNYFAAQDDETSQKKMASLYVRLLGQFLDDIVQSQETIYSEYYKTIPKEVNVESKSPFGRALTESLKSKGFPI